MKGVIYLGAAIALLRSVAAFLPTTNNNNNNDDDDQQAIPNALHLQPGDADPKALDPPTDLTPASQRPPAQPPSPDSNFTLGSPTSRLWAITYTPYTTALTCLPPATIRSDMAAIARKGFTTVRLYSLDCAILPTITPTLYLHSLTLILGIPLDDGLDGATGQIHELISWATTTRTDDDDDDDPLTPPTPKWPLLSLLLLGDEPLFNAHTTPGTLTAYLRTTRALLRAAGYAGPLTITEPLPLLLQHAPLLCPHLDVPASNIHPFFHPSVSAAAAGAYVARQLSVLDALCDDVPGAGRRKPPAINMETGWPTRGLANGRAVPGAAEQRVALEGIVRRAGGRSVVLGWRDEGWRAGGEFGVEGWWGCGGVFGDGGVGV